ncbi:hypothetical protein GCM10022629_88050 [Amorphoplanes auranticolor]
MTLQPTPAPAPDPVAAAAPRPLRLWVSVLLALAAGVALLVSFPPYGLWWLAPVAVAVLAAATHRRRLRGGAGIGMIAGLVFFVPLLDWTNLTAGWLPWILLSSAQAATWRCSAWPGRGCRRCTTGCGVCGR